MGEPSITDWMQAIAEITMAIFSMIIIYQLYLSRKQFEHDHKRSRREKAIDLLMTWSNSLDERNSMTRKFVETLNEDKIRCIYNQESFTIPDKPKSLKRLVAGAIGIKKKDLTIKNNQIIISESQASKLRWQLTKYLNNLEAVLQAWSSNIANKKIIENEFSYLVSPENGHNALKEFRTMAGGANSYPAIELFTIEMEEKKKIKLKKKHKLGK